MSLTVTKEFTKTEVDILNYEEIEKYISDIPRFTKKNSLNHTASFLQKMGNPQKRMKIIHVAGTNGKGSVCAFISGILCKCKKKTGLFVSPHLTDITERISINGNNVNNDKFVQSFHRIKSIVDEMEIKGYSHPGYFEYLFLMAMDIFDKECMEYVVLETGLGGRLDATNVIEQPEVTIISSIGFDHTEILGDTIEKIAGEKAGIIKPYVPVIYQGENTLVNEVIEKNAEENHSETVKCCHADYKIIKKYDNCIDFCVRSGYYLNTIFSIPFIAEYQVENAMLALKAVERLEDIKEDIEHIKEGISGVRWHGRMEQVMPGVYFDGAHNGPGIDEFVKTVSEYQCNGNKYILFSAVKEKDYRYMAEKICKGIMPKKVFVTQIDGDRSLSSHIIANEFKDLDIYISDNIEDAFLKALDEKKTEDVLFCTGSLYLTGELIRLFRQGIVNGGL